jgi:hypothetical protein
MRFKILLEKEEVKMSRRLEYANSLETLYESETATSDKELVTEAIAKLGSLENADCRNMDLRSVHFGTVNCTRTKFNGAIFKNSSFSEANLSHCSFANAVFTDCEFVGADLDYANFTGTVFISCDLTGLKSAENTIFVSAINRRTIFGDAISEEQREDLLGHKQIVPSKGSFIAWKAVAASNGENQIAEIEILDESKRVSTYGTERKCRASSVRVIALYRLDGEKSDETMADSLTYTRNNPSIGYAYNVGEITFADSFNSNPNIECTNGIHFFMTFEEAVQWAEHN